VAEVAAAGGFREGQLVMHMSGGLPLSVLAPAAEAGTLVGCAHPLQSFPTIEDAIRDMPGSVFALTTGSPEARQPLEALVEVLGGSFVEVADDDKALYHAAAVVASNYLVAIEDASIRLLGEVGFDQPSALRALRPLTSVTLANIDKLGTTKALTGPIMRGDCDTVRVHLRALARLPDVQGLYRTLGLYTLQVAGRGRTLDAETVARLREVLEEGS
jgi:predicted short-subunit dehydrogenase-like oxidoreductase (DUF2520 family)